MIPNNKSLSSWIRELIKEGKLYRFYNSKEFKALKAEIFEDYHNECKLCAQRGKYVRAKVAHHVHEVRDYPELALTRYIKKADGTIEENIIPVCFQCHERIHGRAWSGQGQAAREKAEKEAEEFAPERW